MIPAVFLFYRHAQHGRERVVLAPALAGRAGRKLFGGQPARRQPHESPSFPQATLGKLETVLLPTLLLLQNPNSLPTILNRLS